MRHRYTFMPISRTLIGNTRTVSIAIYPSVGNQKAVKRFWGSKWDYAKINAAAEKWCEEINKLADEEQQQFFLAKESFKEKVK